MTFEFEKQKAKDELISVIAKSIADRVGHGMSEKHYVHAEVALEQICEVIRALDVSSLAYSACESRDLHDIETLELAVPYIAHILEGGSPDDLYEALGAQE